MAMVRSVALSGLLLALTAIVGSAQAQEILRKNIDVNAGRADSSIVAGVVPSVANLSRAFDMNALTEVRAVASETLSIRLQFKEVPRVGKCKVYFWTAGKWLLESADSEADLLSRTGSYVRLKDSTAYTVFKWDSVTFAARSTPYLRLSARVPQGSEAILGEWMIEEERTIVAYHLLPHPPKVVPGLTLQLSPKMIDDHGVIYPVMPGDVLTWSTQDTGVATVDQSGRLTGVSLGTTSVAVRNAPQTVTGQEPVSVESDILPEKVPQRVVKVALVVPDPVVGPAGQRLHSRYGWYDPLVLANDVAFHFYEASDSVIVFQFVETIITDSTYSRFHDTLMSVADFIRLYDSGAIVNDTATHFDYVELVKHYGFDQKRNNGEIDEVWVFSPPRTGMYESQLMGPNAFWWNSPPIKTGTALTKLLSVMGLNYERGVDMAVHSFGHRFESAMSEAYFDAQGRNWNSASANPTPWDLFTRYDVSTPNSSHVGNIHWPPNATGDYNYHNSRYVTSFAENWKRYPWLLNESHQVNYTTWYYYTSDPLAEDQAGLGYLRWWYNHIPRYVGATEGVLNDWWHYFLDYEAAVALAKQTPVLGVNTNTPSVPAVYLLEQNYPNPFNPATTIRFQLPHQDVVTLKIYDILGREVAVLLNAQAATAGIHQSVWNASRFGSGVYFCRLTTSSGVHLTIKTMLLK